jgi:hypothetical protein
MPAFSQIARVMFVFVVVSMKPMGVDAVAVAGLPVLLKVLKGAQFFPALSHTSIG